MVTAFNDSMTAGGGCKIAVCAALDGEEISTDLAVFMGSAALLVPTLEIALCLWLNAKTNSFKVTDASVQEHKDNEKTNSSLMDVGKYIRL